VATGHSTAHTVLGYSVWVKSSVDVVWQTDTSGQSQTDAGKVAKVEERGHLNSNQVSHKGLISAHQIHPSAQLESDASGAVQTVENGDSAIDAGAIVPTFGRELLTCGWVDTMLLGR
jgi:hypothetical protein